MASSSNKNPDQPSLDHIPKAEVEGQEADDQEASGRGHERAARLKAAIISLLNNSDVPMSKSEIQGNLSELIESLDYKTSNFESMLYQLVRNELVKSLGKNPNGPGSLYASARHDFPSGKTAPNLPTAKRKYTKRKNLDVAVPQMELEGMRTHKIRKLTEKVAPISIDIIKSTGRIRLSISGLSIDIGVIDDD